MVDRANKQLKGKGVRIANLPEDEQKCQKCDKPAMIRTFGPRGYEYHCHEHDPSFAVQYLRSLKELDKPTLEDQILDFFEGYKEGTIDELIHFLLEFEGSTWKSIDEVKAKVEYLVRTRWIKKAGRKKYRSVKPRFDRATFEAARKYQWHLQVLVSIQKQGSYEQKSPQYIEEMLVKFIEERLESWESSDIGKTRRDPYDCNYIIPKLNVLVSFFKARPDSHTSGFHYCIYALELFTNYSRFHSEKWGFKIRRECHEYLPALVFQYLFECYLHEHLGRGWWLDFTQSDFTMHSHDFPEDLQKALNLPVEETLVFVKPKPNELKVPTKEEIAERDRKLDEFVKNTKHKSDGFWDTFIGRRTG
jgi:hypothetical protein